MIIFIYFSVGAGIYVEHSQYISNSAVANNTAVRLKTVYCDNCRLSFYCLSNSTKNTPKATLLDPRGRKFPTQETYGLRVNWVNSSGFYTHNNGYDIPGQGIYTCEMPDSNGNLLMLSIGVYHNSLGTDSHCYIKYIMCFFSQGLVIIMTALIFTGTPYLYSSTYRDVVSDTSSTALVTVHCYTRSYLPTSVAWLRDGNSFDVDGNRYEAVQFVTDRRNSYYHNILYVRDVVGIIGRPRYTCRLQNSAGNVSGQIDVNIQLSGMGVYCKLMSLMCPMHTMCMSLILQWEFEQISSEPLSQRMEQTIL